MRAFDLSDNEIDLCRVCGLWQDYPPWGDTGFNPTYDICDCCGSEAGVDDKTLGQIWNVRAAWIVHVEVWWRPESKPQNWNWEEQHEQIPEVFLLPPDSNDPYYGYDPSCDYDS